MHTKDEAPGEVSGLAESKIIDLDVRPILNSGGEPFGAIMAAIARTPMDGALRLRATFKPTPLFHVLGAQGWRNWIETGEGDDWIVWFYRSDSAHASSPVTKAETSAAHLQKDDPVLRSRLRAEGDTWHLDVRGLSPPEPMELTLAVLEKLPENAALEQLNERVPQFLLPILVERGFRYEILGKSGEAIRLRIGR